MSNVREGVHVIPEAFYNEKSIWNTNCIYIVPPLALVQ